MFTDQPCSALQATPITGKTLQPLAARSAPPPVMCARDKDALRQSVIEAFASGDANRLAGLMLWDGYGSAAVISRIRSLTTLMKQPLLDVEISDGLPAGRTVSTDDLFADMIAPTAVSDENMLVLDVTGGDGSHVSTLRFSIVRQAGCLWLRKAD